MGAKKEYVLVGDIGGTNSRLGLYDAVAAEQWRQQTSQPQPPVAVHEEVFLNERYERFDDVLGAFFEHEWARGHVAAACLAVAGPIERNRVRMSNRSWELDGHLLAKEHGIPTVRLINDFVAAGYGCLMLGDAELLTLQAGEPLPGAPKAVIGAGTGLGEGFMTPGSDGEYDAFPSEGGHTDFGPRSDLEVALLAFLKRKHGSHTRVSYERVVSGPGLASIYEFLAQRRQAEVLPEVQAELAAAEDQQAGVVARWKDRCTICKDAFAIFLSAYGAEAGNLALKLLPRGGLFVTGGVTEKNLDEMQSGAFLEALRDKGRIAPAIAKVPVHIVLATDLGKRGALLVATRLCSSTAAERPAMVRSLPVRSLPAQPLRMVAPWAVVPRVTAAYAGVPMVRAAPYSPAQTLRVLR